MNGRAVRYFIGHILRWEAILMLPALIIAIMDRSWGAVNGFLITMLLVLLFCIAYVLIKARIRYNRMVKQIMEVPQDTEDPPAGSPSGLLDKHHKENH